MIRSGLVSISFRQLDPAAVIRLAADCGLAGIEWGSDVHVPVEDQARAVEVGKMTMEAGLAVAAYGTYYKLGVSDPDDWPKLLENAAALDTAVLRVWCGDKGSDDADLAYRRRVANDGQRIAELTRDAGKVVACEWHGRTLTDTATSAQLLFDEVDHPAFRTLWQPHFRLTPPQCLVDIETALPRLTGLHVYQWVTGSVERQALAEGDRIWPAYLRKALTRPASAGIEPMYALLEFVKNDDPANLAADAQTLHRWLDELDMDE